jgi:hypothetical protein
MDRKFFRTSLKPGQNEDFGTYWGWSILVPACPGWEEGADLKKCLGRGSDRHRPPWTRTP